MTPTRPLLYQAFGLQIRSTLPLWPDALRRSAPDDADVEVVISDDLSCEATAISLGASEMATHVDGVGALRVARGQTIEIRPEPGVDATTLASAVTGPAIAMALHQRGLLVLHGSCVLVGERALCLAGMSGAGKSTLASALARRGHGLVSDGMTVVDTRGDRVRALRGPRSTKLWPDAAEHLGWAPHDMPRVTPLGDKRVFPLPDADVPNDVELARVFATSAGAPPRIEPLTPGQGAIEILRQVFLVDWVDAASSPALLTRVASVTERLDVARLFRGERLDDLERSADLLESAMCESDSDRQRT